MGYSYDISANENIYELLAKAGLLAKEEYKKMYVVPNILSLCFRGERQVQVEVMDAVFNRQNVIKYIQEVQSQSKKVDG